ncbi:MAG: ComEA family DNA-binding protein [Lachnospiraceae bacterium]|nr:ComEA family DNA-binding protein [Lachnospiraceae bacterium]
MDKRDRRKMCICAVIIAVCMLWMGCGQKEPEVLFEMDGDSADAVSAQEEGTVQPDRSDQPDQESLHAMLEEILAAARADQVIQVTCGCTGEDQVQQIPVGDGAVQVMPVDDGRVNINAADALDLQKLNGIGEARAQAIISYRESIGAFQSVEDIKQVEGIGDGIFDKIKDEISVG